MKRRKVRKVSVNISLGERLKETARQYAESVEMDLSELVAQLLRQELSKPTINPNSKPLQESFSPLDIEKIPAETLEAAKDMNAARKLMQDFEKADQLKKSGQADLAKAAELKKKTK